MPDARCDLNLRRLFCYVARCLVTDDRCDLNLRRLFCYVARCLVTDVT
jgi:hypothetical protein